MSDAPAALRARDPRTWPCLVSVICLLRGLRLFVDATPGTPLRVLAIVALDTLHVLRTSKPLPRERVHEVAMLLDFQACTNAVWDDKDLCAARYQTLRTRLDHAGLASCIETYLSRLRELEIQRPSIGGDSRRFAEVRVYREQVARLSLETILSFALDNEAHGQQGLSTDAGGDLDVLYRIAMQCQIIDDIVDYREDRAAGLPGFLTACASLPQALALTVAAARHYARGGEYASGDGALPLRLALHVCTALTRIALGVAGCRARHAVQDRSIASAATATTSRRSARASRGG